MCLSDVGVVMNTGTRYKAYGQASDAARAQTWTKQLAARLQLQAGHAWTSAQLNQACLLAWLSERLRADGLAEAPLLLQQLDQQLYQQALQRPAAPATASRQACFQVLRYFTLRLAAPTTPGYLQVVLDAWFSLPMPDPQLLGLVQGAATELLLYIQLAQAGFQAASLTQHVRAGLLHLLKVKHHVDFLQQHYSIFPYKISPSSSEAAFSTELSWRRGDLGQALLFYEAHTLLQDPDLLKFANLIGLNTLLRTGVATTKVTTASFCQGAAGVAQLYRQLYRLSRQPAYCQGYQFWLDQTQACLRTELLPDFYAQHPDSREQDLVSVGLVLLSASTPVELGWESSLVVRWSIT